MSNTIQIYDTTLRDGSQREGISLSVDDKLRIAQRLDALGIAFIEGGWPGSNPKDAEFFERAQSITWKHAKITAFGATRRHGLSPQEDPNLKALLDAKTEVCTLVGKTWKLHVTDVLRVSLEQNLEMIEDSVRYLVSQNRRVIYDAEHFFDGYADDTNYALSTLQAAAKAGAETLILCDTNGGTLPWRIDEVIRVVKKQLPNANLGVHCHNDSECAVACSIAAVAAGAVQVQGTFNGYGERCGNANLCAIIPNLELKMGKACLPKGHLGQLYELAHFVAEVVNLAPDEHMAYVGRSAFAHKGGIHVAAMRRNEHSYQHIDPKLIGNKSRVVVSELSGRGNVLSKAEEFGLDVQDATKAADVLEEIKQLEAKGFSFEAAEASVALMLQRKQPGYKPPFEVIDYVAIVEHRSGRGLIADAMVKIKIGDQLIHTAAEGDGPVNALDMALRKALQPTFPKLADFHLVDYKVRILNSADGTAATTRVLIDTRHAADRWSTVGASTNLIEASWRAVADSIEYGLLPNRPTSLAPQRS